MTSSVIACAPVSSESAMTAGRGRPTSTSGMNVKKKRFKFLVSLSVDELTSVPYVSGILFCKVRLLNGGSFKEHSAREEVRDHVVRWRQKFDFQTKMTAQPTTGVLESCLCRISVRKELKGGRQADKLGYVDLDLAHFAGQGQVRRRYLLEGYSSKHRVANIMLQVSAEMKLLSGDPCFKAPTGTGEKSGFKLYLDERVTESRLTEDSGSLGFPSLPRNHNTAASADDCCEDGQGGEPQKCHSRQSSINSQNSTKASLHLCGRDTVSLTSSNSMSGPVLSEQAARSLERRRSSVRSRLEDVKESSTRMSSTRPDPESIVSQVLEETSIKIGSRGGGLQLYMNVKNGTAMVGGAEMESREYKKVVLKPDR